MVFSIYSYLMSKGIMKNTKIHNQIWYLNIRIDITRSNEMMQWKSNLIFFNKKNVFGLIVLMSNIVKPVTHKWVFIQKRNKKSNIIRYKARLTIQEFSQIPWMDYKETYIFLCYGCIACIFLINLTANKNLENIKDVVTTYLYG